MAMPRPTGHALKIAEKVVPGLYRSKKSRSKAPKKKASMSEVEIMQTNNIENKGNLL